MNRRRNRQFLLNNTVRPNVNNFMNKQPKSLENIHRANLSANAIVKSLSSSRSPGSYDRHSSRGLLNRCSEPNLRSRSFEQNKPRILRIFGSPAKNSFLNHLFVKAKRHDIRNSLLFVSDAIDESEISGKKISTKTTESSLTTPPLSDSVSSIRVVKMRSIETDDSQVFVDCFSEETISSTSSQENTISTFSNSTLSEIHQTSVKESTETNKVNDQTESYLSECFDQETHSSSSETLLNNSDSTLIATNELTEDETITNERLNHSIQSDDEISLSNQSTDSISSRKSARLLNKKNLALKKKCRKCDECDNDLNTTKGNKRSKKQQNRHDETSNKLLDDCFSTESSDTLELSSQNKNLLKNTSRNSKKLKSSDDNTKRKSFPYKKSMNSKKTITEHNSNCFGCELSPSSKKKRSSPLLNLNKSIMKRKYINRNTIQDEENIEQQPISSTMRQSLGNLPTSTLTDVSSLSWNSNKRTRRMKTTENSVSNDSLIENCFNSDSNTMDSEPGDNGIITFKQFLSKTLLIQDKNDNKNKLTPDVIDLEDSEGSSIVESESELLALNQVKKRKVTQNAKVTKSTSSLSGCFNENSTISNCNETENESSTIIEKESESLSLNSHKRIKRQKSDKNSISNDSLMKDCFNDDSNTGISNKKTSSFTVTASSSTVSDTLSSNQSKQKKNTNKTTATTINESLNNCFSDNSSDANRDKNEYSMTTRSKSILLNLSESITPRLPKNRLESFESSIEEHPPISSTMRPSLNTNDSSTLSNRRKRKKIIGDLIESIPTTDNSLNSYFNENTSTLNNEKSQNLSPIDTESHSSLISNKSRKRTKKLKGNEESVTNDSLMKDCFNNDTNTVISQTKQISNEIITSSLNVSSDQGKKRQERIIMSPITIIEDSDVSDVEEIEKSSKIEKESQLLGDMLSSKDRKRKINRSVKSTTITTTQNTSLSGCFNENSTFSTENESTTIEKESQSLSSNLSSLRQRKKRKSGECSVSNSSLLKNCFNENSKTIISQVQAFSIPVTESNLNVSNSSTIRNSTIEKEPQPSLDNETFINNNDDITIIESFDEKPLNISKKTDVVDDDDDDEVTIIECITNNSSSSSSKYKNSSIDETNISESITEQTKSNDKLISNNAEESSILERNKTSKQRRLIEINNTSNNNSLNSYFSDNSTTIDSTLKTTHQSQKSAKELQSSVSETLSNQRNNVDDNINQSTTTTTTVANVSLDNCFSENSTVSNFEEATNSTNSNEKSQMSIRRSSRIKNKSSIVVNDESHKTRGQLQKSKDSNSKSIMNLNLRYSSSTSNNCDDDTSSWSFLANALESEFKKDTNSTKSPRKKIIITEDRIIPSSLNTSTSDLDDDEVDECNKTINQFGWSGLFSEQNNKNKAELKMLTNRVGIVQSVRNGVKINKYVILERDGTIKKEKRKRYRWLREDCKEFMKRRILEKFGIEKLDEFIKYVDYIIETITKSKAESVDQTFLNSIFRTFAQHNIIKTPRDFYIFVLRFCPRLFREKVVPRTCFQSTRVTIEYDVKNIDSDILTSSFC